MLRVRPILVAALFILFTCLAQAGIALADFDNAPPPGINPSTVGMQPLVAPFPAATAAPGESPLRRREDGSFDAIPVVRGNQKTFSIVERSAPWTLKPGLTVLATSYNGVVPGPVLEVNEGDRVVINY